MTAGRWTAPLGLESFFTAIPRAMPWATVVRAVGAHIFRPNGAFQDSLGQRPRNGNTPFIPSPNGAAHDSPVNKPITTFCLSL
jgi:hypothetical protein